MIRAEKAYDNAAEPPVERLDVWLNEPQYVETGEKDWYGFTATEKQPPTFSLTAEDANSLVCAWLRGPAGATGPMGPMGMASRESTR